MTMNVLPNHCDPLLRFGIILFSRIAHNFVAGRPIQPSQVTTNFSVDFSESSQFTKQKLGLKKNCIDVLVRTLSPTKATWSTSGILRMKKILNVSLIGSLTWAFMSHSHFPTRNLSK